MLRFVFIHSQGIPLSQISPDVRLVADKTAPHPVTTDIQNPGLQPLLDQSQKRSIVDAFFEHTDHPTMIDIVEKAPDIGLYDV